MIIASQNLHFSVTVYAFNLDFLKTYPLFSKQKQCLYGTKFVVAKDIEITTQLPKITIVCFNYTKMS